MFFLLVVNVGFCKLLGDRSTILFWKDRWATETIEGKISRSGPELADLDRNWAVPIQFQVELHGR